MSDKQQQQQDIFMDENAQLYDSIVSDMMDQLFAKMRGSQGSRPSPPSHDDDEADEAEGPECKQQQQHQQQQQQQ